MAGKALFQIENNAIEEELSLLVGLTLSSRL